jgi:hypothetical protein
MNQVIPLFIEDEITGLKVANRGVPEEWIIEKDGIGYAIYRKWNDVLANIHKYPNDCNVIHFEAIPPQTID